MPDGTLRRYITRFGRSADNFGVTTAVNDRSTVRPISVSIAAVERDTGLSKDTLRVWERRYGFPAPLRDSFGERAYPLDQIEKLRVIKRLLDSGHRPGRIVSLDINALHSIGESLSPTPERAGSAAAVDLRTYLDLIGAHDVDGLRRALGQATMRMGVAGMVCDVIAPLNVMVGDAWMRGLLEVFEEHMYTESVNIALRSAIANAPLAPATASPRVLLTTLPQEPHGLGLLMAEAMLSLEGCRCLSLGTQTPILDIVLAATAHRSEVVALSFTANQNPNYVVNGLAELRRKLPLGVDIWVGGSCPVLQRKPIEGIAVFNDLRGLGAYIDAWRAQRV
jgi:MerR family transcriptional regulator, light-induced transcriptional regulator